MANEEKKSIYVVQILKSDGNHIEAGQMASYDEAFELWEKLTTQWVESVKEVRPFKLLTPVVTAFAPSLIFEITLKPVVETTVSRYKNPYQQNMVANGLSRNLDNGPFVGSDVLDGGYKT